MERLLILAGASYGFLLSRRSTSNIVRMQARAQAGDKEAQGHFTQTRFARVFGPRNSDLGMIFYPVIGLCAVTRLIRHRIILFVCLGASACSVLMSIYLLWALFFRLRVPCSICIRSHVVNFGLFALLVRHWIHGDNK